jgi:glutamate dehydrogenase/leucine dehydrogenase
MSSVGTDVFDVLARGGHEQLVLLSDPRVGLRAFVAVHSTRLGPALGGVRFRSYPSERAAISDVLRLSRTMTYKAALADLPLGGGKAVIVGDPRRDYDAELIRSFARAIDRLGGRYIAAEDVGIGQADVDLMRGETAWVVGASPALGGLGSPAQSTAVGLVGAMRAAAVHRFGSRSLAAVRVAIMGVGKVGRLLATFLCREDAEVIVADVDRDAIAEVVESADVTVGDATTIHAADCDIFAPCAVGGVISRRSIPELRCAAVVGSANNQLAEFADAQRLADRGVLYIPDFAANAGGLIQVAAELDGLSMADATDRVLRVEQTCGAVITSSTRDDVLPLVAAYRMARRRLGEGLTRHASHAFADDIEHTRAPERTRRRLDRPRAFHEKERP